MTIMINAINQNDIKSLLDKLQFNSQNLIPAIAQDTNDMILMMAWMNPEALRLTINTKIVHYFSRSRNKLWKKGETSGHLQHLQTIKTDCDYDTILLNVVQIGNACHLDKPSCFFRDIDIGNDLNQNI